MALLDLTVERSDREALERVYRLSAATEPITRDHRVVHSRFGDALDRHPHLRGSLRAPVAS
jgi:hypothetical protein